MVNPMHISHTHSPHYIIYIISHTHHTTLTTRHHTTGIQLLPITVVSEDRDSPEWVREMLPLFNESCALNSCESVSFSHLEYTCSHTCSLVTTTHAYCHQYNWLGLFYTHAQPWTVLYVVCTRDGWSILVFTSMATVGDWRGAWDGLNALPPTAYLAAGGNGHSRTNSLWYIATRPTSTSVLKL